MQLKSIARAGFAGAMLSLASAATADTGKPDHTAQTADYFNSNVAAWAELPEVIDALKKQNALTASYSPEQVIELDDAWRAEVALENGPRPMVEDVMEREISQVLKQKQRAADWMVVEIILMDAKGLNAGLSVPTSDFWQGDEGKFQNTFDQATDDLFIDEVEYEPETGLLLSQVSRTVFDPSTGEPIGALTVSINMNKL